MQYSCTAATECLIPARRQCQHHLERADPPGRRKKLHSIVSRHLRPGSLLNRRSREGVPKMADWAALPSALERSAELASEQRRLVVFLDYDGTLTPIVEESVRARGASKIRPLPPPARRARADPPLPSRRAQR